MNKTILVVAAHADDEVLGCAGALARHSAEGDSVHVLFLTDGVSARPGAGSNEQLTRAAAATAAHAILGVKGIGCLGFPDNRMDGIPLLDVVQHLETVIADLRPEMVYTHHLGDLNVDHRVAYQAVMTACRPLPSATVREIRCFEVLSSTEWAGPGTRQFEPNMFVDISGYLDKKLAAASAYAAEMRSTPHSRCIAHLEALAKHRGYSVGVDAAEAFVLARQIC